MFSACFVTLKTLRYAPRASYARTDAATTPPLLGPSSLHATETDHIYKVSEICIFGVFRLHAAVFGPRLYHLNLQMASFVP
jgi:hypothetical protein